MHRKDYERVATTIRGQMDRASPETANALTTVAEDLADVFALDNPRFDRDRFLDAAGVEE